MKLELSNFVLYAGDTEEIQLFSVGNALFQSGKLNFISGPSGTGKTTFLNTLYGMKSHYEGRIKLEGADYDAERISVSYVTADLCIIPELTILDYLHILSREEEEIERLLSAFHLQSRKKTRLSRCSRGEQERAELCAALLRNSDLYLLDEPTANIDSETKKCVYEVLNDFAKEHFVIVATHDETFLKQDCYLWSIEGHVLKEKNSLEETDDIIADSHRKAKKAKFPYFPFIFHCGYHHKGWLITGILFSVIAFALTFLSSSFLLIDRNQTLSTAIKNLPYDYNRISEIQSGETPGENDILVTTSAELPFSDIDSINLVCLEDLRGEQREKCESILKDYEERENDNLHPIILTEEQIQYFENKKRPLSLGDIVPLSIEKCVLGVDHTTVHDDFILAGVLDYGTDSSDLDKQHHDLSSSFPAIIRRADYLSCLLHTGYRDAVFNDSLLHLYTDYKAYCFRNGIACPDFRNDYFCFYNLYPYSWLKEEKVDPISSFPDSLQQNAILLPYDTEGTFLSGLYSMFCDGASDNAFLKNYETNGKHHFPLTDGFQEIGLEEHSFSIAGQYKIKDESVSKKDTIIVSDECYGKLIDQISHGFKESGINARYFVGAQYLNNHIDAILNDPSLLSSDTFRKCVIAYRNGAKFSRFVMVVSSLFALVAAILFTAFSVNEKTFLDSDFQVLCLLGKNKKFCLRLFFLILSSVSVFSLLISYLFSHPLSDAILAFVCRNNGFQGSFVLSNQGIPYLFSFLMLLLLLSLSFGVSVLTRKKRK